MRVKIIVLFAVLMASPACLAAAPEPLITKLERLAAAGNAEAMYYLGMSHHVGAGLRRDPAKALATFRKAAALGDPLAAYKLGCYYDGQGEGLVADDPAQALRYKLVAAEAGYALAQQDVAALLMRTNRPSAALPWIRRAASQGWPDALMGYATLSNGKNGLPEDRVITAAFFRLYLARTEASPAQQQWLAKYEAALSREERQRADALVTDYRAMPTALTVKALSGQRAAEALVSRQ